MSKIQVVWFRDLTRWDTKNYMNQIQSRFPLKPLREFIVENTDKIKPFDFPQQKFDILGVTNKEGVYFNESLLGSQIKQPYYRVNSGDIFYNPYRVNVGSIGIVPKEFDGKFTSPAYVVFRTKKTELLAEYLVFILKSSWFNSHLRANTKGSVRQNLSFESLCELQIPLPPLEIQNNIVADIHAIQNKIKALQEEEKRLKDEIEAYIYIALGLQKPQTTAKQKVFTVRFKDLDRWDTTYNQSKAINVDFSNNAESIKIKYPLVKLEKICCFINRDWRAYYKNTQFPYIQISDVEPNIITKYSLIEYDNAPSRAKTLVKKGELILSLTRPNLSAFAIIEERHHNYVVSSGFAVVDSKNAITNQFVNYILQSSIGVNIFNSLMTGAVYPAISTNELKQIKIPLPPLDIQKDIVAFVEAKTSHIREITQERTTLQNSIESKLQEMLMS